MNINEMIMDKLPPADAELSRTEEFYLDLALRGVGQQELMRGVSFGRAPNHEALVFGMSVASRGFYRAITEHQIGCTKAYEAMLNEPNRRVGPEEAERRASAITREAHHAELGAMEAEFERYAINGKWKERRASIAADLIRGPRRRLIRNCGAPIIEEDKKGQLRFA